MYKLLGGLTFMSINILSLEKQYPIILDITKGKEIFWKNPDY